jgi:hypothetical protein
VSEVTDPQQPRPHAGASAAGMLLASLVAAVTYFHFSGGLFCSSERSRGANIDHALAVAFAGGLAGSLLLLFVRKRRRLLAAALFLGAAVLGVAIVFVMLDSARYVAQRSCGFLESTETRIDERVYYLYVLWGAPAAFLLWGALQKLLPGRLQAAPFSRATPASIFRLTRAGVFRLGGIAAVTALAAWAVAESGSHARTKLPPGTTVFAEPDHDHVDGKVRYNRTPPAGGPHNDRWLNCGVYARPVKNESAVHSLEHGAVWITYAPQVAPAGVSRLRRFVRTHYEGRERYLILSPYPGLNEPVVASAWGAQLRLKGPADPRLAAFVDHFEGGAQGGEAGGPCTDGAGSPSG